MGLFHVLNERRVARFLLGGLLAGGASVALITTAAQKFLKRAREKRHGIKCQTEPVAPDEVETALGEERIQWLMRQTGLTRHELLAGLRFN